MEVRDRRIFCVDTGRTGLSNLLVLHGFPTSSLDFHRVIDVLSERYRVVVHDHLGFGFSAKPARYSYSLLEQAEMAFELWHELGIERGHLLAHDYGTSVATEVLARRERGGIPVELESVTLANGSVLIELAKLRLSQRLMRSSTWGPIFSRLVTRSYFTMVMRRLWGDPKRAEAEDFDAMWACIRENDGHLRAPQISSYLDERVRFRSRWLGALQRLDLPVHLLWGRRDPIAVPAIAEQLAREIPEARLTWLDELGHYAMLEDSERWGRDALDFLDHVDAEKTKRKSSGQR